MVKKEMFSHNNYRETFWEIAFWCLTSSHRVPPFPSWNSLLTLFSWILQRYIWELIEGYGEKGNILRRKLERSPLRNCISICECNSQSYTFLFTVLTQISGNLEWDTSERNEAYGDKGNILRWKLESNFPRNLMVMCDFISQSYTYISCNSRRSMFLRNLRRNNWDHIEAYTEK